MDREGHFVERRFTVASRLMKVKSARLLEHRQSLPSFALLQQQTRRRYKSAIVPQTAQTMRGARERDAAKSVTILLNPCRDLLADGQGAGPGRDRAFTAKEAYTETEDSRWPPIGSRSATFPEIGTSKTNNNTIRKLRSQPYRMTQKLDVDDECDPDMQERKEADDIDRYQSHVDKGRDNLVSFTMNKDPVVMGRVRSFMEDQRRFNFYNPMPRDVQRSTEEGRFSYSSVRSAGPRVLTTTRGSKIDVEDTRKVIAERFRVALNAHSS